MKVLIDPKPQSMVNAIMIMFIVHSMQLGVGIQGFQRIIYLEAGHDAWISVIISGIAVHIIAWTMIKTLSPYQSSDLYGIHFDVFGKWLGGMLSIMYVTYMLGGFYVIIRNYIEVIQAWVFPDLANWFMSLTILFLIGYGISGGLRTMIGVSFFSIILSFWIIFLLTYPIQFANWDYLFPVLESDVLSILKGAQKMTFTIIGFEIIYFVYPFLKEKDKVNKYMHFGLLFTTLLYLGLMVVSLAYFSGGQLERTIWGTLSMFKIVRMPFIERFEYVAVSYWIILIMPNLMLSLWAASRGISRLFNKDEKKISWVFLAVLFAVIQIPLTRVGINIVNEYYAKIAFYIVFGYTFFLFFSARIKRKFFQKQGGKEQ